MKQHMIPRCYQASWCDPVTPPGHTPSIWRFPKADRAHPFRRSPEKSFIGIDRYTERQPDGTESLAVEQALGKLETEFIGVLSLINKGELLLPKHRVTLAWFAAAMLSRTDRYSEPVRKLLSGAKDQALRLERKRGAPPGLSRELGEELTNVIPEVVRGITLKTAPLLSEMNLTVFITEDEAGFITSDDPCVQSIPHSREHATVAHPKVEVTLPLSPLHLALFTWNAQGSLYKVGNRELVDEANARTFLACDKEFVSWKGLLRDIWFIRNS